MGKATADSSFKNLVAGQNLPASIQVITGFDSQADLLYGSKVKIFSNSSIRLEKLANQFRLHLLSGEVERLEDSQTLQFFIDNKKRSEKNLKKDRGAVVAINEINNLEASSIESQSTEDKELNQILARTFKGHQRFIEKCFIKYYEKNQGQAISGKVLLSFYINKRGILEKIKVVDSPYSDKSFQDCLIEVASRVQVKSAIARGLEVRFPVEIRLP